jgi:hypothetical protein
MVGVGLPGGKSVNGTLQVEPGFDLDGGTIKVSLGSTLSLRGTPDRPVRLRNVRIEPHFHANVKAEYVVFDDCTFVKGPGNYDNAGNTTHWELSHCVLHQSNFHKFNRTDFGVHIERCAFVNCTVPPRRWSTANEKNPDMAKLAGAKWSAITECDFYHCEIGLPSLWMTRHCNFFDCRVTDKGEFAGKSDLTVELGLAGGDDHALIDAAKAGTSATDAGHVKYAAASAPFDNEIGLGK